MVGTVQKPFGEGAGQAVRSVHWNTRSVGLEITYADNGYPTSGSEVDNSLYFNIFVVDGDVGYHLAGDSQPIVGGHPAPLGLTVASVWTLIKDNYIGRKKPSSVQLRAQIQLPEGTVPRLGAVSWFSWQNKANGDMGGPLTGGPSVSNGVLTGPMDAQRGGWSATMNLNTAVISNARLEDRDRF